MNLRPNLWPNFVPYLFPSIPLTIRSVFSTNPKPHFDFSSQKPFNGPSVRENVLQFLLGFMSTIVVLHAFLPQLKSTVITDASPSGIEAVLEGNGYSMLSMSRGLSPAEREYSRIQRETYFNLSVYASNICKYLVHISLL